MQVCGRGPLAPLDWGFVPENDHANCDFRPFSAGFRCALHRRTAGLHRCGELQWRRYGRLLGGAFRRGARVFDYGPTAIGELSGRLDGQGPCLPVRDAGLAEGCVLPVLRESLDLRVLEVCGERCQEYGGAGISVAGEYLKVDSRLTG